MGVTTSYTRLSPEQAKGIDGFKVRAPKASDRRYTFSVQKIHHEDGKRRQRDFSVPEIDAINLQLRAGAISGADAEKKVAAILVQMRFELADLKRAALYSTEAAKSSPVEEPPPVIPQSDRVKYLPHIMLHMPTGTHFSIPNGYDSTPIKVDISPEIYELKRSELENAVSFQFRAPDKKHTKFRLLKSVRDEFDQMRSVTLKLRAVDTINRAFNEDRAARDTRALEKALHKGEALKTQLEARCGMIEPKIPWLNYNLQVLYRYFSEVVLPRIDSLQTTKRSQCVAFHAQRRPD